MSVTVGADPEFFLRNTDTGKPHPVCGLIGGTKAKPIKLSRSLRPDFTLQEDNVMVEFNIPPARSADKFCEYINTAMVKIYEKLAFLGPFAASDKSELEFHNSMLDSDKAREFGCSPDFDAHASGNEFAKLDRSALRTKTGEWRFAGGHIHVGYSAQIPTFVAASFADFFIGLNLVGWDNQCLRRKYYGQPGRFRPTSYGIEYRTPSNFWLFNDHGRSLVAYNAFAFGNFLENSSISELKTFYQNIPWLSVVEAINTNDQNMAINIRSFVEAEFGLTTGAY